MKKIFVLILISIIMLPLSVAAGNLDVKTLDVTDNNGKLTVSGTTDNGVLAVAILVYSGSDLVDMESCSNDNGFSCELKKTFDSGTYTVKAANYDGGDYVTKDVTVVRTESNESNPKTGDNIVLYIILGIVSLLGLTGCGLYIKKRFN